MNSFILPPSMDYFPEFCFCGRKTIESHEFWFCSTKCARLDSLRSLDNPRSHYRNVVQAHFRAGPVPRRMMSADNLRLQQGAVPNTPLPPIPPQGNATFAPGVSTTAGFPTLSQVAGKVLTKKANAREPLVGGRPERPRWEGLPNATSRPRPGGPTVEQITLDSVPLPDHVPVRTLRRIPSMFDGVRNNARKHLRLNSGKSQKAKEGENPEKIFGHSVDPIVPPARKESLPTHCQTSTSSKATKALRRSVSCSGWNATSHSARGHVNDQDSLMHAIEEMREELSESFDPRSLFNQEED